MSDKLDPKKVEEIIDKIILNNNNSNEKNDSMEYIAEEKGNSLIGIWEYEDGTRYEFNEDLSGGMYVGDYKYEYNYSLDGNAIKIDNMK